MVGSRERRIGRLPRKVEHGVKFLGVEGVSPSDFEDRL